MVNFIKKILLFILGLINQFFYYISSFSRRNQNIWLFGSYKNKYNDNSKAFFEFVNETHNEINSIWITGSFKTKKLVKSRGYKSFLRYEPLGIYYLLKGYFVFYNMYVNDVSFLAAQNTIKINLWHGIGLKKIEFSVKSGKVYEMLHSKSLTDKVIKKSIYFEKYIKPDYFVSTTDFQSIPFSKAFRIEHKQCLNIGTPRTDIFFQNKKYILDLKQKEQDNFFIDFISRNRQYNKVIIYMPTWRDSNNDFISSINFEEINNLLKLENSLLIVRPHFNTKTNVSFINTFSNIELYNNSIDLYPFLIFTDILITDYSSIYYDYLLLNKQVLFYLFDIDNYISDSRSFNYNFEENTGCYKAYDFNQFKQICKELLQEKHPQFQNKINCDYKDKQLRKLFWGEYKGDANEKLFAFLINKM